MPAALPRPMKGREPMIGTEGTAGGVAPSTEGGVDAMRTMLLQRRHEGLSAFLAPSSLSSNNMKGRSEPGNPLSPDEAPRSLCAVS